MKYVPNIVAKTLSNADKARTLVRGLFVSSADIEPDRVILFARVLGSAGVTAILKALQFNPASGGTKI